MAFEQNYMLNNAFAYLSDAIVLSWENLYFVCSAKTLRFQKPDRKIQSIDPRRKSARIKKKKKKV